MGAGGGGGGAGGAQAHPYAYDPAMAGRGDLFRGFGAGNATAEDPYMVVAYKDESRAGQDANGMINSVMNGITMRKSEYDSRKSDILSAAQNYGYKGLQDLIGKDPTKYYDITKNLLLDQKWHYDKHGIAMDQELNSVYKDLPDTWNKAGGTFESFDKAVAAKKAAIDAEGTTTTGGTPSTGSGGGGEVSDGSLLTSAAKEKKRLADLQATNGALTLGSVSLLGG